MQLVIIKKLNDSLTAGTEVPSVDDHAGRHLIKTGYALQVTEGKTAKEVYSEFKESKKK